MERPVYRKELILLVEDEADAARLLAFHLQKRGYETVVAADGRTALNEAFERKPSLIVLDLMLPQLHGFEVVRLLKSSPLADVPVIMLTAMVTMEDKLKGFKLGADDFMTKPYEMKELLARVQALLGRTRKTSLAVNL